MRQILPFAAMTVLYLVGNGFAQDAQPVVTDTWYTTPKLKITPLTSDTYALPQNAAHPDNLNPPGDKRLGRFVFSEGANFARYHDLAGNTTSSPSLVIYDGMTVDIMADGRYWVRFIAEAPAEAVLRLELTFHKQKESTLGNKPFTLSLLPIPLTGNGSGSMKSGQLFLVEYSAQSPILKHYAAPKPPTKENEVVPLREGAPKVEETNGATIVDEFSGFIHNYTCSRSGSARFGTSPR